LIALNGRVGAALTACVIAATALLATGAETAAASSSSSIPFTDSQAEGYVGLCDLAGHNVTSGSVASVPFVWKAVSSVRPPAAYRGAGQNADLAIYQARQGLDPGDWAGLGLIGDTQYKYSQEPTAEATYKDVSLESIVLSAPPSWDGLYALRMNFGKSNYGIYGATYPMTVIQVTGKTWHVVDGGLVNCKHAEGVSLETISGVADQLPPKPIPNGLATAAPATARATQSAQPNPGSSGSPAPGGSNRLSQSVTDPISAPVALANSGGGVSTTLLVVVGAVVLVAVALGGLAIGRRQANRGRST
jgi:hypothetical protein